MSLRIMRPSLISAGGLVLLATLACSSGSDDPATTGSTTGSGGSGGDGSGGSTSTTSSGGSTSTSTSSTSTSSTTSAAGAAGGAGAPGGPEVMFSFDDGLEGFTNGDDLPEDTNLSAEATISHDTAESFAGGGSMKVEVPFDGYTQGAEVQFNYPDGTSEDLSGHVVTVMIKLADDGGFTPNPASPGGMLFFMKSGDAWAWGQAPWVNLEVPGEWIEVTFDPDNLDIANSPSFDASVVKSIGFKFDTGSGENAEPTELPTPGTFWVDEVIKTPK